MTEDPFARCPVTVEQAVLLIRTHPGHVLEFARTSPSGRVHVLRPWVSEGMNNDPDGLQVSGLWFPEGILGWSLCGHRINLNPTSEGRVSAFVDTDLCVSCHAHLGDQSDRCFDHDRPEEI